MNDTEFIHSLRWRLGLPLTIPGQLCRHQASRDSRRQCLHPLDLCMHHAIICKLGGGPSNRVHKAIQSTLGTALEDAGYEAKLEVPVPEFSRPNPRMQPSGDGGWDSKDEDGVMDISAWSTLYGEFLVDVSVRHPASVRYADQAWHTDGVANKRADTEKQARYPPSGGKQVITAAIETWGRCGKELRDLLVMISAHARARDSSRGLPPQRYLRKWRLKLSTGLNRALSRAFSDALVADAGKPRE